MSDKIVSLDALDHLIEGDTTACGLAVPEDAGQVEDTNKCPECFAEKPKAKKTK